MTELSVNKASVLTLQMASCEHTGGSSRFKHYDLCIRKSPVEVMGRSNGERGLEIRDNLSISVVWAA